MAMSQDVYKERLKAYGRVVARAWEDEAFKQRLLADPKATLEAEGVRFPAGAEVRAVEDTDRLFYVPIPPKPAGLSTEELNGVVGGAGTFDSFFSAACMCG